MFLFWTLRAYLDHILGSDGVEEPARIRGGRVGAQEPERSTYAAYERINLDSYVELYRQCSFVGDIDLNESNSVSNKVHRGIEQQAKLIYQKQKRGAGSRLLEAITDEDEVIKHYRKIESLFRRLQVRPLYLLLIYEP